MAFPSLNIITSLGPKPSLARPTSNAARNGRARLVSRRRLLQSAVQIRQGVVQCSVLMFYGKPADFSPRRENDLDLPGCLASGQQDLRERWWEAWHGLRFLLTSRGAIHSASQLRETATAVHPGTWSRVQSPPPAGPLRARHGRRRRPLLDQEHRVDPPPARALEPPAACLRHGRPSFEQTLNTTQAIPSQALSFHTNK